MYVSFSSLIPLYLGTIQRLDIIVWPDPDGLSETDVRLHLVVDCVDGETRMVTVRTAGDGSTPGFDFETWEPVAEFLELTTRLQEWRKHRTILNNGGSDIFPLNYEAFDVLDSPMSRIRKGARIEGISIIRFVDNGDPTGIVFEFDEHKRIISAPAGYGNSIHRSIDDFMFPGEVFVDPLVGPGSAGVL